MCRYCDKRALNRAIRDIDNNKESSIIVSKLQTPVLRVELDGVDEEGHKLVDFFEIAYCPMCGKHL